MYTKLKTGVYTFSPDPLVALLQIQKMSKSSFVENSSD